MLKINDKFCVIDRWIVDVEEKKVVSHKSITRFLTPDENRKLSRIEDLRDLENVDTKSTVICYSRCEELFTYLKTEDVEFVTLSGRTVKKNSEPHRLATEPATDEFTLKSHPIALEGRNKGCLYLSVPDERTAKYLSFLDFPFKMKTGEVLNFHVDVPKIDSFHLLMAGNAYFGVPDFEYKTREQMAYTTTVALCDHIKISGLNAFAGFGTSLTYILPMMALKRLCKIHHVNFVCVPNKSKRAATIEKLRKGGLNVEEFSTSFSNDAGVYYVDVFVGGLESFAADNIGKNFKNWEQGFGGTAQLGYLVFEDAHLLAPEPHFGSIARNVRDLSWEKWRKILFLSNTMDEDLYREIVLERNIPSEFKDASLFITCYDKTL